MDQSFYSRPVSILLFVPTLLFFFFCLPLSFIPQLLLEIPNPGKKRFKKYPTPLLHCVQLTPLLSGSIWTGSGSGGPSLSPGPIPRVCPKQIAFFLWKKGPGFGELPYSPHPVPAVPTQCRFGMGTGALVLPLLPGSCTWAVKAKIWFCWWQR